MDARVSPYVLAATQERWALAPDALPPAAGSLKLTAKGMTREFTESVPVVAARP